MRKMKLGEAVILLGIAFGLADGGVGACIAVLGLIIVLNGYFDKRS